MEILIDPELAVKRRQRAARHIDPQAAFLLDIVAEEIAFRLTTIERSFEEAYELFGATGDVGRACEATGKIGHMHRIDTAEALKPDILATSFEDVPIGPDSANLVLAPLCLHLVNDVPGTLIRIRRALRPDGLFMAAVPGVGTLQELHDVLVEADLRILGGASPRVLPFGDVRSVGALLQRADLALPVADVENYTVRYENIFALMRDLRIMGMTNVLEARSRVPLQRRYFMEAAKIYQDRFSDRDGRIRATFSVIYLSGWAPHESQQKPLKPGSAKMRLADALRPPGKD